MPDHSRRHYRKCMQPAGFVSFNCKIKETDLQIAVDEKSYYPQLEALVEKRILAYRLQLEQYIVQDPLFAETLQTHLVPLQAPLIVLAMTRAANQAEVGPMAAVAGAVAEFVGRDLLAAVDEVIVENGGDIFLSVKKKTKVAVYAGNSPLSNRLAIEVPPQKNGFGICTSSGTVGPSFSFGRADAAVIVSSSAVLADAVATAAANRVQTSEDLQNALQFARQVPGVSGILLIKDDKLAAWGQLKLVSL